MRSRIGKRGGKWKIGERRGWGMVCVERLWECGDGNYQEQR